MIQINNISPIDRTSTYKVLADIETDYLAKFKTGSNPLDYLDELIKKRKYRSTAKAKNEVAVLNYLKKELWNIVCKKPQQLHQIIGLFERKGWQKLIYTNKPTSFGVSLLKAFGYSSRFRSQVNRGIWLAKQLNIKACPYCNAQSTLIATTGKGTAIAKFQFDHFFSKDKYPYLSISLYNLIPSCANCNITKSKKLLSLSSHYHPYYSDFSVYFKFYLKYNPDPAKLSLHQVKKQNLEIELRPRSNKCKAFVDDHNNMYHITGVYERHQDIAEELLIKAIVYNKYLQKSHLTIKNLFPDRSTYLRYLLGTYTDSASILKRPLTKFIQDLAHQLKIYQ